jgi:hypothetical protein
MTLILKASSTQLTIAGVRSLFSLGFGITLFLKVPHPMRYLMLLGCVSFVIPAVVAALRRNSELEHQGRQYPIALAAFLHSRRSEILCARFVWAGCARSRDRGKGDR